MGKLSAAAITRIDVGVADAKISDDKAGDTLYWAVRESPYTDADVDAIKSGSGATDNGNLVSELGENAVSAVGLPYETPMNFGFVSEAAAVAPPTGDNYLIWTEDFSKWAQQRSAVTSGQVGPTSSNATLFAGDGVSANGRVERRQTTTALAAGTYTVSISAKADTASSLVINVDHSVTGDGFTRFNLETGAVQSSDADHADVGMVSEANDYWRCHFSITTVEAKDVEWEFWVSEDTSDWLSPVDEDSIFITQAQVNSGALAAYLKVEDGA